MKRNLLKKSYKYILGAAALPLFAGCCVGVPMVRGVIVAKADKTLGVDLNGDGVVDQKLYVSPEYGYWTEYAQIGDSIMYEQENSDPIVRVSEQSYSNIGRINSLDLFQVQRELQTNGPRRQTGHGQKTR